MRQAATLVEVTPFSSNDGPLAKSALDIPEILSGDFWGELRVFLAVAKGRSFGKAAEILNTSSKTVSRHVKRLQDVVGAPLLEQTAHGVILTPGGRQLAERLAELDYRLFKISEDVRSTDNAIEASVRLGVTEALGAFFVAPCMPTFRLKYPRINLEVRNLINANDLRENSVDLMLASAPMLGNDLVMERCGTFHFIPVVSKGYVAAHGMPSMDNLHEHYFIHSEYFDTDFWNPWKQLVKQGAIVAKTDNSFTYGTMGISGLGIALLGSYMTMHEHLVPLHLNVHIRAPLFVASLKDTLSNQSVRAVRSWMMEIFSSRNPWFADDIALDPHPTGYDRGLRDVFNI